MTLSVTRHDDQLIAVKPANSDDPERARREADLLERLDHPGIVSFVAFADDEPALHTVYVGTDTWARTPPADSAAIIDGLFGVASTVADLHDLGVAHRALSPEHVIVAADGRPVLCGLGDSTAIDPIAEADDLAGFAGLVRHLAGRAGPELRAPLEDLADEASTGQLTMSGLTERLSAMPSPVAGRRSRRPLSRRTAIVLAILATVAGAIGVAGLAAGEPAALPATDTSPPAPRPTGPRPTDPPSTTAPSTTAASAEAPDAAASLALPRPTAPEAALEFVHEGRRYGLGEVADVAALGDWNCNGVATPALLRPSTGMVARYDTWPEPDGEVKPTATTVAPDAVGLEAVETGDCHQLRILEPDGSQLFTAEPA